MRSLLSISLTFSALLAGLPATGQDAGPSEVPRLEASPPRVDFGEAYEGEVLHQEVGLTNAGSTPWPVSRIQTSCGCTVAKLFAPDGSEIPNKPKANEALVTLQPGETLKTAVEFRTAGKHGAVNQTMQVFNLDPAVPAVSVPVAVKVSRALSVNPPHVNLGTLSKSSAVEQVLTIDSIEIGAWSIKGFANQIEGQDLPPWLEIKVLDAEGATRRVQLATKGPLPIGGLSARVRILIDHPRIPAADVIVTGIVRPDVSFDSGNANFAENINFEKFPATESITRTLTIVNSDPTVPYRLQSVQVISTEKDFFKVEQVVIEEGVKYEVRVTADGALAKSFFRGNLELRAEHPDVPSKLIPFHGWILQ